MNTAVSTPAQAVLWLLILVPAVVGAALLLGRRTCRYAAAVSVSTAAVLVGLSIGVALARPRIEVAFVAGADFGLGVDDLAAVTVPVIAAVTVLVLVFATVDIGAAPGRFHGLMLVFVSAVMLTATAVTVPALLLGWEVMGAASYALIGFRWQDEHRVSAGRRDHHQHGIRRSARRVLHTGHGTGIHRRRTGISR